MTFDIRHVGSYSGRIAAWIHVWQRCRDAVAGQDAVKFRGVFYLPRPPGMEDEEVYSFFTCVTRHGLMRRVAYYARDCTGRCFVAFRKFPSFHLMYQERLDNITGLGHSILDLAKMAAWEQLLVGRYGVLVFPSDEHPVPRVSTWGAEQIIGIQYTGQSLMALDHLSHVRLMDTVETPELASQITFARYHVGN